MRRFATVLGLALAACTATGAPTVGTDPPSYLADFPLGSSQEYVIETMGQPDNKTTAEGREVWSYELGRGRDVRRWSFVFEAGRVYDVIYNDQGPCNGITARLVQYNSGVC